MRLFVAAPLPDSTKSEVERALAPLRGSLPKASWTRSDSLHITFAFIGDCGEPARDVLKISDTPFDVVVKGCGLFPNERRPRVAWLGLEPRDRLERLAAQVRESLRASKISFDDKHYTAHLTVARLRTGWPRAAVEQFTKTLANFETAPTPLDRVILYESQLSPRGAVHTPLHVENI